MIQNRSIYLKDGSFHFRLFFTIVAPIKAKHNSAYTYQTYNQTKIVNDRTYQSIHFYINHVKTEDMDLTKLL